MKLSTKLAMLDALSNAEEFIRSHGEEGWAILNDKNEQK